MQRKNKQKKENRSLKKEQLRRWKTHADGEKEVERKYGRKEYLK